MGKLQTLLIDVEGENGPIGYSLRSKDGKKIEIVLAGKSISNVSQIEGNIKIYKLLEENCDVIFCTTQKLDDFEFYPVPKFSIFAVDSKGNCFGTIGGTGDMEDDNYPVGYVNRNGMYGKIADSLKEFFELITFYPYWRDMLKYEQIEVSYDIRAMKMKKIKNAPQYLHRQREISEILKLSKNPKSIERLISNIKSTSEFVIYGSKDEAQKTNTFLDKHFL